MKYKIWIVASKEISSLFSVLGAEARVVNDKESALKEILEMKKEKQNQDDTNSPLKYWIIFVLEDYLMDISNDDYKKISSWALPAVIAIPSHKWSTWYWERKIRSIVEKAVWSDIFW